MSGRVAIPTLERLRTFVRRLGGTHQLVAEGLTGPSADKLRWLLEADRNLTDMGGEMPAQMRRFLQAAVARAARSTDPHAVVHLLDEAAKAGGRLVLLRFRNNGGDARPMRPLSPAYLARKRALGRDPNIGVATGVLYRNLARARWRLVRLGV